MLTSWTDVRLQVPGRRQPWFETATQTGRTSNGPPRCLADGAQTADHASRPPDAFTRPHPYFVEPHLHLAIPLRR